MATISSHVLDGVNGCSAAGVRVTCTRIDASGKRSPVFDTTTDDEGRISETVSVAPGDGGLYELAFATADYFAGKSAGGHEPNIVSTLLVRITMPDSERRYHIPMIVSPHSQSMWWSA